MKVVFRVDSSLLIGTGHVMRCLTLANAIKAQYPNDSEVTFICRDHPGNIIHLVENAGLMVFKLPCLPDASKNNANTLAHSDWLGSSQPQDALVCQPILEKIQPDWLIVDHYAIDYVWHNCLKPHYKKLMVIDDIADRGHQCDVLLDQNYGKQASDYLLLAPTGSTLLLGTKYALLRPEFQKWRSFSLDRRRNPDFKQLLITMGGIDANNVTGQILSELSDCNLLETNVTVVMGGTGPWLEQVKLQAAAMPYPTKVLINVSNMAELMANADLAIGAAGSTSWERCCLGLPTITVVLAENQKMIATALEKMGAAKQLDAANISAINTLLQEITTDELSAMSHCAANIVDGLGVERVLSQLTLN